MAHTYVLGAVKPWVKDAAYEVGNKFDVGTIYGVAARTGASEHPKGRALDFMVYTDKAKGDQIYAYGKANWGRLGIMYIIWQQQIDEGSGLKPMEDRGSATANHRDHNHWSFLDHAGSGGDPVNTPAGSGAGGGGGGDTSAALAALASASTWIRVLEFVAGVVLLAVMLWPIINRASGGLI